MPSFSIVIPAYRGARYLPSALDSVFTQTLPPGQVIVVDDCSGDDTADVARSISASSPIPMQVLSTSTNSGGPARPLNIGIAAARGEYISVLEQDDLYLPQRLAQFNAALERTPGAKFAFSACGLVNAPQRHPSVQPRRVWERLLATDSGLDSMKLVPGDILLEMLLEHGNFTVGFPALVFHRSLWSPKRGIDETLRIAADLDWVAHLASQSDAVVLGEILYLRREHRANLSESVPVEVTLDVIRILRRYWPILKAQTGDGYLHAIRAYYLRRMIALGWVGAHGEAVRRCLRAAWRWGSIVPATDSLAKLCIICILRMMMRERPQVSPETWGRFLIEADALEKELNVPPR